MLDTIKTLFKDNENTIVVFLLQLVVGIFLLVNPTRFTAVVFVAFGVYLLVNAIRSGLRYFRSPTATAIRTQDLTVALIFLIIGVFLIAGAGSWVSIPSFMASVYGVLLLLSAAAKIQWGVDNVRLGNPLWFCPLAVALIAIIFGALVIAGVFPLGVVWLVIAWTLIALCVLDAVAAYMLIGGSKRTPLTGHRMPGAPASAAVGTTTASSTAASPADSAQTVVSGSSNSGVDVNVYATDSKEHGGTDSAK